ncbi:ABC transporter substrate-binding protein [Paracoccus sp. (in: a-proteobacteria)]|uniref:ABC transporter substrate-binding protein n=1 Tax=Paracoccus sp. TaxID=267 RepID=UPI003220977A
MIRQLILAAMLALAASGAAAAELAVQLRGPTLAASAGYHLAHARGYYADESLQVTLLPPSDGPALESLARGEAQLAVEWLPAALVAREHGLPLVNIAQVFARPALRLTCNGDAGVAEAGDLRGKTVGSRFGGSELPLLAWLNRLGLRSDGSLSGVALLNQGEGDAMLRQKQADCISTLRHDPPGLPDTVTLDPATQGAALLEDGIYVLAPLLAKPGMDRQLAGFLRASMRGWHEALADPEATAHLLLGPDPDAGALAHNTRMLRDMAGILAPGFRPDEAALRHGIDTLLAGGPQAVLARPPEGALTHAIRDIAAQPQVAQTP